MQVWGRQIFGGKMRNPDGTRVRNHFDSFLWALVTVFQVRYRTPGLLSLLLYASAFSQYCNLECQFVQVMTPENWNTVLVDAKRFVGWGGALYIVSLYVLGTRWYLLLCRVCLAL